MMSLMLLKASFGKRLDTGYLRFAAVRLIHADRLEHTCRGNAAADFYYLPRGLCPHKTMQELRFDRSESGTNTPGGDFVE